MSNPKQEAFEDHPDAGAVAKMFIEWADHFEFDEDLKVKYEDFFTEYGIAKVEADIVLPSGRYLFLVVGEGSEGGPSTLIGYFDKLAMDEDWELEAIFHLFDLTPDLIWANARGGFQWPSS